MKLLLIKIVMNLIAILFVEVVLIGGFYYTLGGEELDEVLRTLAFILGCFAGGCTFAAIGQSVSEFVDKEYGA